MKKGGCTYQIRAWLVSERRTAAVKYYVNSLFIFHPPSSLTFLPYVSTLVIPSVLSFRWVNLWIATNMANGNMCDPCDRHITFNLNKVQDRMQKGEPCWIFPICLSRSTLHLSPPAMHPWKLTCIKGVNELSHFLPTIWGQLIDSTTDWKKGEEWDEVSIS